MGGKKKVSLKQIERFDKKREKEKKPAKSLVSLDKKAAGIMSPDPRSEKVIGVLKKLKVLTPYAVATRFDLRLSVAKALLKELEKRGTIKYVSGSENIKIYSFPD
jgi:small subunit ribosomal protein S25e